jgi:hypothetical protein
LKAGPLFFSVTLPQPIIPQFILSRIIARVKGEGINLVKLQSKQKTFRHAQV